MNPVKDEEARLRQLGELLVELRPTDSEYDWPWLVPATGRRLDKKSANKFFLGAVLDIQWSADYSWGNTKWFAEEYLGDPENLWHRISEFTENEWSELREKVILHRYAKTQTKIHRLARAVVRDYEGDVRRIWEDKSYHETLLALERLISGPATARMIAGALLDRKYIADAAGDMKPDLHVRRVLGRIAVGKEFAESEVHVWGRKIKPENPWLLDRSLYDLGRTVCKATSPACVDCYVGKHGLCVYASRG